MVVKYAHSEKEVIVAHNQKDTMEKKMKEAIKERDVLLEKIKVMNNEKTRVCNMLEAKVPYSFQCFTAKKITLHTIYVPY